MSDVRIPESFIPVRRLAARIGVPAAWLKREAAAGRVPSLRVGRRLLMNREAVERVLLQRAEDEVIGRVVAESAVVPSRGDS